MKRNSKCCRKKTIITPGTEEFDIVPTFHTYSLAHISLFVGFVLWNWLVHPKASEFVDAILDSSSTITLEGKAKEIPWVETLQGKRWDQTKIPVNPFEIDDSHAAKALAIVKEMIKKLEKTISPLSEGWLWEIDLKARNSEKMDRITIDSLWGGYTP